MRVFYAEMDLGSNKLKSLKLGVFKTETKTKT